MAAKVTNNAFGTLASGITDADTAIVLSAGQGSRFPVLGAGDFFYATLVDASNNNEIIKVTARSDDSLTVERAADNTTSRAFSLGDRIELRPVAALLNGKLDTTDAVATFLDKTQTAADAAKLGGVAPGNYLRRDVAGNWELASGTVGTGFAEAALEIRETSFVGNAQTSANYAPRLSFHWSGRSAAQFSLDGNGKITLLNGAGNAEADFGAAGVTATGTVSAGNGYIAGGNAATKLTMTTNGINRGFLGADANSCLILRNASNATVMATDNAGNSTFSGNVTAYSDERLKDNWRPLRSDFIRVLAGVKYGIYDRKDSGETQVGVSAQALRRALPEAVMEDADGMLSVAYSNAALVASIALANEVEELRRVVRQLQRRVTELEYKK